MNCINNPKSLEHEESKGISICAPTTHISYMCQF